jgi:hypothetical protein
VLASVRILERELGLIEDNMGAFDGLEALRQLSADVNTTAVNS